MSYRTIIKAMLRRAGYVVYRFPPEGPKVPTTYTYALIHPYATLAPWLADAAFMKTYDVVRHFSLVDIYRMYELWSLVAETAKIGGDLVEVGVWRGGTGCMMAHREALLGGQGAIYLCDTFTGVVKAGAADSRYKGGEHSDTSISVVQDLNRRLGNENVRILEGIFPDETSAQMPSMRVRLLHIDVDVYRSALDCIDFLWDRMPSGAVIVFDDYGFAGLDGITRCVDELRRRNDLLYLYNLNGHAVLIKR